MTPLADVVDVQALLEVIGWALAAGIGVSVSFSLTILGATRFADLRRDHVGMAAIYGVLGVLAGAACIAAIVFGIIVMTSKA